MSLAIIRRQNPYRIHTTHFLHTQEDSKECCYKIVVKKVIQSVEYDKIEDFIQTETVATYYARVITAVHEALELHEDCFVEVHINGDR